MSNFDTLFLDRDGVINVKLEGKYVQDFSEFKFISGSLSAISKLSQIFSRIIIVTNQQGIGKGIMSQSDLNTLHFKMQKQTISFIYIQTRGRPVHTFTSFSSHSCKRTVIQQPITTLCMVIIRPEI